MLGGAHAYTTYRGVLKQPEKQKDTSMANLERLRAVVTGGRPVGQRGAAVVRLSPSCRRAHDPAEVARALGGALEESDAPFADSDPRRPSIVVRRDYAFDQQYGRCRLGDYPPLENGIRGNDPLRALEGPRGASRADDDTGAGRVVCFDLETTGLSGGAGTVPFLIGLGWFEGDAFHTCQYFLASLAAERRCLAAVSPRLASVSALVTFNGRSFDGPVIDTRFALHRMPSPLAGRPHIDLLHPARRLWPMPETRLVSLERSVLGVRRVGDVPGAEIPGRYAAFLRGGDITLLEPILEHNRLDLVSLGVLTALACRLVAEGPEAVSRSVQALGLGRTLEAVGRGEEARGCYERVLELASSSEQTVAAEALSRLAVAHRRRGRYGEAARCWQRLLALPEAPRRFWREAAVALAVHHEHRDQDLLAARRLAHVALERERHPTHRRAVEHRLERLDRKLGVAGSAGDRG